MSGEMLAGIGGVILQLAFAYIPGLSAWYEKQGGQIKGLVMLGSLFLVSIGAVALACLDWFGIPLTCDQAGIEQVVKSFFIALASNQSIFLTVVKPGKANTQARADLQAAQVYWLGDKENVG